MEGKPGIKAQDERRGNVIGKKVRCRGNGVPKRSAVRKHNYSIINSKGFTLVELIITIIILGILAAVAIPLMGGLQRDAADAAAKATLGNLRSCGTMEVARINTGGKPLQNFNLFNCVEQRGFTNYSQLVVDNPPFHFLMPCNSGGISGYGVQWCQIDTPLYGTISFDIAGERHDCLLYVGTDSTFYIFDPVHPSW